MAQSLADVVVTSTWQSINTTTGIAVGTKMLITNKSTVPMVVWETLWCGLCAFKLSFEIGFLCLAVFRVALGQSFPLLAR